MNQESPLHHKLRFATVLSLSLYAAILLLILYWNLTRDIGFKPAVFALQALPLIALLPGMLKKAYRSYSWLCFLLLFYFIFAVQHVLSSLRQTSDFIFLFLIVTLFISSMMTSRWLQRFQKGFS